MSAIAKRICLTALVAACGAPAASYAHPHVFAEANLEVSVADDATVEALRHVWRFDDLFSSTVLIEFDQNADLELDAEELDLVGSVILESLAEFGYFQIVTANGKDVAMQAPDQIMATYEDSQLTILFESRPTAALPLTGAVDFGVYDPTFYTAIDYLDDDQLVVNNLPDGCARSIVRPDPDEAIAQNQETLTEAFFDDPTGNDFSKIFATRLALDCSARS